MKEIEVGDIVDVLYNDGSELKGVYVKHAPCDVGDMWKFYYNRRLIYQNPLSLNLDCIVKHKDKEE